MNAEPLVVLDHVDVGYGQRLVLRDVCLQLPRGSFAALLGGNGSGKTTLLKTLAGLLRPLAGRVTYMPVNGQPPTIGYVPQREALDPLFLLSGFEVALMGTYGRVPPGRRVPARERDFVRQCLRLTGAEAFADQPFARLSGGQKQRVLVARALACRPQLMLLDEPIAGIDPPAVEAIMDTLAALHRDWGLTVVLVTHNLAVARRYVDRVLALCRGRLLEGTPEDLAAPEKLAQLLDFALA